MSGLWVFVCGPSGSGKDSVMDFARQSLSGLPDIVFARRMVTRPVQPGSDHDPVTAPGFAQLLQSGGLCWHWQAHGFCYGIASPYADAVRAGRLVVVNGSRAHVNSLPRSPDLRVVRISTDPDRLATRLAQRARDSDAAIAERLARNAAFSAMPADCVIVNDGELQMAGRRLADYLTASAIPADEACSRTPT
ncbi:MAG: phosphonate metabolism protein/1,5-bisphosphokinase (PRPP-forming) PhnN [Polaromonas sp.]|uniref:phosphonate metabolism protein/1,5-bisphosphokinase (PRPP-forming) PhnN n=1 Tax=Polaromonas sp. TaxID=1869339 RepID=UPI002488DCD3|nr:phosphonate metabolism protein/1,5-bisphosphokinase (PRPP-forming) PhnN [Polaromonas sp.]MDI1235989.1 phosphonate metabolism protein/1,5-bisphosphokinase (PRPP-forming) PhnN [Polaromonas sp.]MDI1341096.1 phosphonate metabolism protein/1,5-bisphosphokinase (PRPP-forming) PhnN [Polaromonas sp.]